MRRHPVIFGLFLLILIGLFSFVLFFGLSFLRDGAIGSGEKIGVVSVKGIIADSKSTVEQISKYKEDSQIKSIVVRIDSPGGGVAASQEIYESILAAKKKKKVVASLGSIAASGGYYIACAADKIVSNPGTVTGSIGAIMHFTNVEDTLKKIGLKASAVKSGKYKDIGSPIREMTRDERDLLQDVINDIYDQFIEAISVNRRIPKEKLAGFADGRIFTGRQALKLGLVDVLGDLESAVKMAASLSGIKGKPEVVYPKEKRFSLWKYLMDETKSALIGEIRRDIVGSGGAYYLSRDWQMEY